MGSGQGWFESDEAYRARTQTEANERTIESATGSAPSQGWFESENEYHARLEKEANEQTISRSSGAAPSQGWFESDKDYQNRIEQEANEAIIRGETQSNLSQGWFESDDSYNTRVRQEANESILRRAGQTPRQGWFEGNHEYRSRINHEANVERSREPSGSSGSGSSYSGGGSYGGAGKSSAVGSIVTLFSVLLITVLAISWVVQGEKPKPIVSAPRSWEESRPMPAVYRQADIPYQLARYRLGADFRVTLSFTIDTDGRVSQIALRGFDLVGAYFNNPIKRIGAPDKNVQKELLVSSSAKALSTFRFNPQKLGGQLSRRQAKAEFYFYSNHKQNWTTEVRVRVLE